MQARREGMIWQVLGLLVMIAAAMEIRSAAQDFTATFSQNYTGEMDIVWPFAMEVFAGFLLLAGAAAMISGHVLRVLSGVTHRAWIWRLAGWFCCFAGLAVIVEKMTLVAMSREGHYSLSVMKQDQEFLQMLRSGGFAIWISGGYVFLLGIMLLMADRLGNAPKPSQCSGRAA